MVNAALIAWLLGCMWASTFLAVLWLLHRVMWLTEDLTAAQDIDHAKCIGAVSAFVGDEFAAQVLRVAAEDYDSVEHEHELQMVAREYRQGGPSVPALWMLDRANRILGES